MSLSFSTISKAQGAISPVSGVTAMVQVDTGDLVILGKTEAYTHDSGAPVALRNTSGPGRKCSRWTDLLRSQTAGLRINRDFSTFHFPSPIKLPNNPPKQSLQRLGDTLRVYFEY